MSACGTRTSYVNGCRCAPCTEANRIYNRNYERHKRRVSYGIETPRVVFVDATEAREHLRWLSSIGIGRRTVHQVSGVSLSQIMKITRGETRKIKPDTAQRILCVGAFHKPGAARIDATQARKQVADLKAAGWSNLAINVRIGGKHAYSNPIGFQQITVARARAIDALWRQVMASTIARREENARLKRDYRQRAAA
jgi:hypothetical protein